MRVPESPDPSRQPKTVEEIAAATGFSRTTVRCVINGQAERYRISQTTRAAIEAYVARHGYQIDHAARSLKLKRSDTVGLVVPDLANAYFARLTAELEEHCRRRLVLLTASTREDPTREARALDHLVARGVDGVILAPCAPPTPERLVRRGRRVAAVVIDRHFAPARLPTVVADNEAMARRVTERLIAEGGGVVFLAARPGLPSIAARIRGFAAAHAAAGLAPETARLETAEEDSAEAGARLMRRLIERDGIPTRFLCSSLLVFEGALDALQRSAGAVPAATAIATFDHHPLIDLIPNRIYSVRQDERTIAGTAFARLAAEMEAGGDAPAAAEVVVVPGGLFDGRRPIA
jgi:LacI family fructose operon transcriptional repressor